MSKLSTIKNAIETLGSVHCNKVLWSAHKASLTKIEKDMQGRKLAINEHVDMEIRDFQVLLYCCDLKKSVMAARAIYLDGDVILAYKQLTIVYLYEKDELIVSGANDSQDDRFQLTVPGSWRNRDSQKAL